MFLLIIISSLVAVVSAGIYSEICGTRPAVRLQTRLFNGRTAATGAWPWIGRMVPRPPNWECMVVLVDEQYALTPVACGQQDDITSIVFGDTEIDGSSPNRQEATFQRVVTHPDYISLAQNDIAILKLDSPVIITDYVRPVCLSDIENESEAYDNCWIAGWGEINASPEFPQFLQEAPSGARSKKECQDSAKSHGAAYHPSLLCGLSGLDSEPHMCSYDFGAPMMCFSEDDRWYLVGQSIGYAGHCGNSTTLYSRTSYLQDYITDIINRLEDCSEPDMMCNEGDTCVLEEEICDGQETCPDGGDEIGCPGCFNDTCLNGGTCQDTSEGYLCLCAHGSSGKNCEIVDCGTSTIELTPGTPLNLTSPLYPENYPLDTTCEYTVSAPNGYKVLVEFLDFDLELGYDYFYINDSALSGDNAPNNYTSADDTLTIRFVSDTVYNFRGYLLRLSAIDVSGVNECEWKPCAFNGTCTDEEDGYSCECVDERLGRNCITPVDHCDAKDINIKDGSSYNLTSFYYNIGNVYGIQFGCKHIVTVPEGHHVRVEFIDVDLKLQYDALILDKQVYNNEDEFISDDNILEIVYRISTQANGFDLVLHDYIPMDGDECASEPCQNGGICIDKENGFSCKCRRGFLGRTCQEEKGLSPCGRNSYFCNNGRCVKASNVCDGRNHCGDGSDELNCKLSKLNNLSQIVDYYDCMKNDIPIKNQLFENTFLNQIFA
ncbi:uncharacterized protein [Amphiura filiformis]|uniref:uncharacterized protein n=1 Tax=Amphiura filiformis TaxID=82378 RepID=UPI003B212BDC